MTPDPFSKQRKEHRDYCDAHAAPLPEVEEAMGVLGYLLDGFNIPALSKYRKALAVIKAALRPAPTSGDEEDDEFVNPYLLHGEELARTEAAIKRGERR